MFRVEYGTRMRDWVIKKTLISVKMQRDNIETGETFRSNQTRSELRDARYLEAKFFLATRQRFISNGRPYEEIRWWIAAKWEEARSRETRYVLEEEVPLTRFLWLPSALSLRRIVGPCTRARCSQGNTYAAIQSRVSGFGLFRAAICFEKKEHLANKAGCCAIVSPSDHLPE